jgi:cell division protein FtsW
MSKLDAFRNSFKSDYVLILFVLALSLFGLAMISSASAVISYERYNYTSYYVVRQAIALVVGVMAMLICAQIPYQRWQQLSIPFMGIMIVLLIAVFIPGIGLKLGGAHRWINLGPILIQPSEFVKLALIGYLATWFCRRGQVIVKDTKRGLIPFFAILGLIIVLVIKQPDLGTVVIIGLTAVTMFFIAGASLTQILITVFIIFFGFSFFILSAQYRWQRLLTYLNPAVDTQGAGYQINQSLIAIGSGGLFGLGFGQSRQKYLYLPQPHIDSIFAVIAEELGFIRVTLLIGLFMFFIARCFRIARQAPDDFGRLLAAGISSWILFQFFINIGAITHIIPLTGVPLPFISYGGSALVALMAGVGILLNISKFERK